MVVGGGDSDGSWGGGGGRRYDDESRGPPPRVSDNLAMGKIPLTTSRTSSFGCGFGRDSSDRTRMSLSPPSVMEGGALSEPVKSSRPSPFGEARPREEVLAGKGLDWKIVDAEIDAKQTTSMPTSVDSSQPTSSSSRPQSHDQRVVDFTDQRPLSQSARSDDSRHMEPRGRSKRGDRL
ncbi:hypothetical protein C5167_047159 [Papaver somniferum]|uniref:Uncharacterized protein n=1 Tax=Papaver somniferum TaxID=3469 RepID=A0A4Y7LIQ2_PAPSO|nr:eukaryotic translation initiation factor 4B1-like [Papaver somniferum]RZC84368.1 hypothetical protein C5167_047159 [Papaver somniferum]